ncbi:aldehyde oxidoreductase [Halobacteriales archaeon SW_12_71_31]|nr:MAG: aldehyde oxidoreductase [Halobacteriales archaeon SW_12_71_31]
MGVEHVSVQGVEVPALGLGTWRADGREVYRAVSTALEAGYRHVDTAEVYDNEEEVGEAIADSPVDRDEVWVTTKVLPATKLDYRRTREGAVASLDRLGLDYVDLVLLHWPNPVASLEGQLAALNDLADDGAIGHVGVSNFGRRRLARARELSDRPVLTNQVQFHPFRTQRPTLRYCQDNDVMLTAYSPLGHGGVVGDDLLAEVGARYDKSAPQVAIRWALQHRNVAAVPKSTSPEHIRANAAVFDFSLTEAEMDRIARESPLRTGVAWMRGRLGV